MNHDSVIPRVTRRDPDGYDFTRKALENIFRNHMHRLHKVIDLARQIRQGLDGISPFIQQATQSVCPRCRDVCCIAKHGYHNHEDHVYLYALGLSPPLHEFWRDDHEPCQYLSENGCSMDRSVRPSGCNWYFCEPLFDYLELQPDYRKFDDSFHEIAGLWLAMTEEFSLVVSRMPE